MSVATALQRVATKVTNKFGKTVTLRRATTLAYNTTTRASELGTADESFKAVVSHYQTHELGPDVRAKDLKVTIPAASLTGAAPTSNDRLVIDSVSHEVVSVTATHAQDSVVLYDVQARA